jgi:hypothetical protein
MPIEMERREVHGIFAVSLGRRNLSIPSTNEH